ncbi:hypothetical protein JCM11641_001025 [Rhodosporidiobolus odoratus]
MSAYPTSSLGKPPVLLDLPPEAIDDFLLAFDLYFDIKSVTDERRKVMMVGLSLGGFVELAAWWSGSRSTHLTKGYTQFVEEFKKEAYPRDYVWEMERDIRESRQREKDYGVWAAALRNQQQSIGVAVMNDFTFVKNLLFNMDTELSSHLRQHPVLSGTGLHEDDLANIGIRSSTATATTSATANATAPAASLYSHTVDYPRFDRAARNQWSIIAARKADVARQVAAASKKAGGVGSTSRAAANAATSTINTPLLPHAPSHPRLPPPLSCLSSARTWMRPTGALVAASPGKTTAPEDVPRLSLASEWRFPQVSKQEIPSPLRPALSHRLRRSRPVPPPLPPRPPLSPLQPDSALSPSKTTRTTRRSKHGSLAQNPNRMVKRLGLVRRKLGRAVRAKLAIEGTHGLPLISEYVRVRLRMENGLFDAGETVLKVAALEAPYDIILGNPFLYRHKLSLRLHPRPQLLLPATNKSPEIDLFAPIYGPPTLNQALPTLPEERRAKIYRASVLARIAVLEVEVKERKEQAKMKKEMEGLKEELMEEFRDRFPHGLPSVEEADKSPKDLLADPRWLNDYRALNANTVPDRTPLPIPDEIPSTAASKKLWGKIDMSDAFFQTLMAEEDIEKTAIKTPWGLYEWVVMPQGLCNAPATHQRRINEALGSLNGTICFAFVDDIIIYSDFLDEHRRHCRLVLSALCAAGLYCSPKKTDLATLDTEFLGHRISQNGIGADPNKVKRVVKWTTPAGPTTSSSRRGR